MFKYAFIANVADATPENYSFTYDNAESHSFVTGTSSFEMTKELVKKLDQEGYDLIDLCGDFDDEAVEQLLKETKSEMEISHAEYLPEELAKLEALDSLQEYGVVIVMDGVEETEAFELKNPDCHMCVRFTKDLDAAKAAARELADRGIHFLELCSYFEKDFTLQIIDAIDGRVPVGSCGDLK